MSELRVTYVVETHGSGGNYDQRIGTEHPTLDEAKVTLGYLTGGKLWRETTLESGAVIRERVEV